MLLLSLSNRGLNLWAVERVLSGLVAGQATYVMPSGTLEILNVIYSQPTLQDGALVAISGGAAKVVPLSTAIRIGVLFSSPYTGALSLTGTSNTLVSVNSDSYVAGLWYWFDLPVATADTYFGVTGASPGIQDIGVVILLRDLPMTPINRDTYMSLPNKAQQSRPSVNYWFEKKLSPQNTLWPVPNNNVDHLTLMRHRQVQDVGTLSQQIEVPSRWLEAITWQLSLRLAFELPGIDPARIQLVNSMAGQYLFEDELGETDGMPSQIMPRIAPYTR